MSKEPRKRHLWQLLNLVTNYKVKDNTPRAWWTRNQLVEELSDACFQEPQSWEKRLRDKRFLYFSERLPEYSWLAQQVLRVESRLHVLDVGCVANTDYFLRHLLAHYQHVHFLNLVSEPLAANGPISYYCQDIRQHRLERGFFDTVTCVSTLEHVGGDNSYNALGGQGTAELKPELGGWWEALRALFGLASPQGQLLITTPYDDGQWHGGEYRFGKSDVTRIRDLAEEQGRGVESWFMLKDEGGWSRMQDEEAFDQARPNLPPGANRVVLWRFA
jgi:hypothetical protein